MSDDPSDRILAKLVILEAGQKQLDAGQQRLEVGRKQLEAGQQRLEADQRQLEAGQRQLRIDLMGRMERLGDDIRKNS